MSWFWMKFWRGMLLLPVLVIIVSVIDGESLSFNVPLIAFVIVWISCVLLLIRRLGVPPFAKGDDDG